MTPCKKLSVQRLMLMAALLINQLFTQFALAATEQPGSVAASADTLVQWIKTGVAQNDHRSYWNCSIDSQPKVTDLHVRFWQNEQGYSGHHPMQWKAKSKSALELQFNESVFALSDISFGQGNDGPDTLFATDSTGAPVLCLWMGPLRGSSSTEFQLDEATNLLASQLINSNNQLWRCTGTDNKGVSSALELRFGRYGVGVQGNNDNYLWYVDTRYNVILSYQDDITVLSDIVFHSDSETNDRFVASALSDRIECNRGNG